MAAESKARQKSLNGWRKREGGFNYREANRQATLSIVPLPAFSRSATLSLKQRKILQHLLFVLYLLRLLNKTARRAVGFGRWRNTNNRPLPRSHSPPLKNAISTGRAAMAFSALPGFVVLITILLFSSINIAHAQNASFISAEDFKRPAVIKEQLFPPAQEQKVDEGRYMLAMAPQDFNNQQDQNKMFNQQGPDWIAKETGLDINLPDLSDPHGVDVYETRNLEGMLNNPKLSPEMKARVQKVLAARKQTLLKDLGYYSGALDSIAGPMTRRAWSAFERDSRSENWRTRYALALKFFEAGKRTGRIDYYNQTVEHLFWIAQTYSILLPTKVRNEMYDLLIDFDNAISLHFSDEWRKKMEEKMGPIVWLGKDMSNYERDQMSIKFYQIQIYLFPNRGPPRTGLRILHAEDQVPLREMNEEETLIILYGSRKDRENLFYRLFPDKLKQ
ncbi:hypothetical protein ACX8XN_11905 [Calditrichota bacterium GD2]